VLQEAKEDARVEHVVVLFVGGEGGLVGLNRDQAGQDRCEGALAAVAAQQQGELVLQLAERFACGVGVPAARLEPQVHVVGVLDEVAFERYAVGPVRKMIATVKRERPGTPVIAFPKGAGYQYRGYREKTGADMIALDWTVPLDVAVQMQKEGPVQGNLDPLRVVAGREAIREGVDRILDALSGGPFVFNLGHGITPQADPDDMAYLVDCVRGKA